MSGPVKLEAPEPSIERAPTTVADVLSRWRVEGPLVHEPTEIPTLDESTGGGPPYGARVYLNGAPDAGKTGVVVQWADTLLARGVVVGIHAVDEEDGDVVTRLLQRRGFRRHECEQRGDLLDMMTGKVDGPLFFYGPSWTIEDATADLAKRSTGKRCAYFVDSIQTVSCATTLAASKEPSAREAVTANVWALRAAAATYKLLAVATCEMNRGAYRSVEAAEQTNDMASGRESSAIEYSARLLLALRSVKDEPDLVHCRIVKNKLGKSNVDIWLTIDRARQTYSETEAPAAPEPEAEIDTTDDDVAAVRMAILKRGTVNGISNLRAAVRADGKRVSNSKINTAVVRLRDARELAEDGPPNRPRWSIRSVADEVSRESA